MSATADDVPQKLRKEINKLRSIYNYNEITIDRVDGMILIEYFTSFKRNNIKLCFKFNMNSIASTIDISIKNISNKDKHNINAAAVGFMTSMVMDKFIEQIDNMPIYKSIEEWDREFALKTLSSTTSSSKPSTSNSRKSADSTKISLSVASKSKLEQRVIKRAKDKIKEKGLKHGQRQKQEKEYIVFLRFNQLFEGTQHKKEGQILSEMKNLLHSDGIYGYILYGTPGIICIGSTSKIIKKFVKKCNEIGKKAVISYNMEMKGRHFARNRIEDTKDDKHHTQLLYLLKTFKFKDNIKILHIVLTGNVAESRNHKKKKEKKQSSVSKGIYVEGAKYEFNVNISVSWPWNYHQQNNNAILYVTIYGQNDNKLVSNHRFQSKRWNGSNLKFDFSSIDFLNKIGNLTKIYIKNDGKESRQIHSVTINVYQMNIKNKKKAKGPSILAKQYEKRLNDVYIKSNSSLFINLS